MNDYKSVYKNSGMLPRTADEAFKTADYATPIWRCEDDTDRAKHYFANTAIALLFVLLAVSLLSWLGS